MERRMNWDSYLDMQWKCEDLLKEGWAPFHWGKFRETIWLKLEPLLIESFIVFESWKWEVPGLEERVQNPVDFFVVLSS